MLILRVFDYQNKFGNRGEIELLHAKLADPMFLKFVGVQMDEAAKQLSSLDPSNTPNEKALDYLQAARDAKQTHKFWSDFYGFLTDLQQNKL